MRLVFVMLLSMLCDLQHIMRDLVSWQLALWLETNPIRMSRLGTRKDPGSVAAPSRSCGGDVMAYRVGLGCSIIAALQQQCATGPELWACLGHLDPRFPTRLLLISLTTNNRMSGCMGGGMHVQGCMDIRLHCCMSSQYGFICLYYSTGLVLTSLFSLRALCMDPALMHMHCCMSLLRSIPATYGHIGLPDVFARRF